MQNYEISDSKIKREFEAYGPIKQVCISEHSLTGSVRFFEMAARSHVLFAICLILRLEVYWFLNFYAQLFPLRPEVEMFLNCHVSPSFSLLIKATGAFTHNLLK